jgi:hypothetical protein
MLMLLLMFAVLTGLIALFYNINLSAEKTTKTEQQRSQEQITLAKQADPSNTKITSITLSNTGTIEAKITTLYVTGNDGQITYIDIATKNIQGNIAPGETLTIDDEVFGTNLDINTPILASTERGIQTIDGPLPTPTPTPPPEVDTNRFIYGPIELIFTDFWGKNYNGKFNPDNGWLPGWIVNIPKGGESFAWNVGVRNVGDKDIALNSYSSFTTVSSGSNNLLSWYLYSDATHTNIIKAGDTTPTNLAFVYKTPDTGNVKIYPSPCTCMVFLTFFGTYQVDGNPAGTYGQTIPFEATITVNAP